MSVAIDVGCPVSRIAQLGGIGARGIAPVGQLRPAVYLELHLEQGPVLEAEALDVGVVTGVQGISWREFSVSGSAAHGGTTPMTPRRDAGVVASGIALEAHAIATEVGPPQMAMDGRMRFAPDPVNVVPEQAVLTVDLCHTDEVTLPADEARLFSAAERLTAAEACSVSRATLARFEPVARDMELVDQVVLAAGRLGLSHRGMPSGAGDDARMFAPNCPPAMIFAQSQDEISHNITENTALKHLANGVRPQAELALAGAGVVQPEGATA